MQQNQIVTSQSFREAIFIYKQGAALAGYGVRIE